jgi:hypothetical protein
MTEPEPVAVECYSGYTYAQEPRAFIWEGQRYSVAEIEARWRAPDGPAFRVRTESGLQFNLAFHELEDRWTVVPLPEC